jgi:hypothetical protein
MTRTMSILCTLAAALTLPAACGSQVDVQPSEDAPYATGLFGDNGMVGLPCKPSPEQDPLFSGFELSEITIEYGNALCGNDHICLVDRFQGRVSCPDGQAKPSSCSVDGDCASGDCQSGICLDDVDCTAEQSPVSTSVCGQCGERGAAEAVHCSCRCGPAPGEKPEPGATYCGCPTGFTCAPLVRFGDSRGSYCVREASDTFDPSGCGVVEGYWEPRCHGLPSSP